MANISTPTKITLKKAALIITLSLADEHYHSEIEERDRILKTGKQGRNFVFPDMKIAQWNALDDDR